MISKQTIRIPGENECSEMTVLLVTSLLVLSLVFGVFLGVGLDKANHFNTFLFIYPSFELKL